VRVIDHQGEVLPAFDSLEPSRHLRCSLESSHDGIEVDTQRERTSGCHERIADVVCTRQRQAHRGVAGGGAKPETRTTRSTLLVGRSHVCLSGTPDLERAAELVRDSEAERIVDIDYTRFTIEVRE
jgi:hypothetical protein